MLVDPSASYLLIVVSGAGSEQNMDQVEERPVITSTDCPTHVNASSVIIAITYGPVWTSLPPIVSQNQCFIIGYKINRSLPYYCHLSYYNSPVQVTTFAISSCVVATATPGHGNGIQAYVSPVYLVLSIYLASFGFLFKL